MNRGTTLTIAALCAAAALSLPARAGVWNGYAGNAQHTAVAPVATQSLQTIKWQTPVDLAPQYQPNGNLLAHYGSPVITDDNTVIIPVKTGANGGFRIEAHDGANGALRWSATTDYLLPPHNWKPPYQPTLTANGRVYYPGAGGTVWYQDGLDTSTPSAPTRVAFFGDATYAANASVFNAGVFINTPLTADAAGNVFFGYHVTGANPLNLSSGIARIAPNGAATYTSAVAATPNDPGVTKFAMNAAPAINGNTLYAVTTTGNRGRGNLVALNATTLAPIASVTLKDAKNPANNASIADDSTASPTIGPDGRVYFGVLENPFTNARGWLLNFNASLTQQGTPGGFGWDDTASVVDRSLVPSYTGTSPYLLMVKYNSYAGLGGGQGVNRLAILDPNASQADTFTGATVMKEILTITGPTPDQDRVANFPDAVREWCINTAVVDPATKSVLANSEDGKLYRWDLTTNALTEVVVLTEGIGEAYTPTLVGADGTVYAINNATLFAVGVPEPTGALAIAGVTLLFSHRRCRRIYR